MSADITDLSRKMKGVRTIARLGMPSEEKAQVKDDVLSFIKSSYSASVRRYCISFRPEGEKVRILLSSNMRVMAEGQTSSGQGLLQIRSEIPISEIPYLQHDFIYDAFFNADFYNTLTEEFLSEHKTVEMNEERLPNLLSSPHTYETKDAELAFHEASNTYFAEGGLGTELFLWAATMAANEGINVRIVVGDILSKEWGALSCFRNNHISYSNLQLPHLVVKDRNLDKDNFFNKSSPSDIYGHRFEIHELAAIYQALVISKKRLTIIQYKRRRSLSILIEAVEQSMIEQAEMIFNDVEQQTEDS